MYPALDLSVQEAARLEVEQKESALVALQLELHDAHTAHAALAAEKQHADRALAGTRNEYEALQRLLASAESRLEQASRDHRRHERASMSKPTTAAANIFFMAYTPGRPLMAYSPGRSYYCLLRSMTDC